MSLGLVRLPNHAWKKASALHFKCPGTVYQVLPPRFENHRFFIDFPTLVGGAFSKPFAQLWRVIRGLTGVMLEPLKGNMGSRTDGTGVCHSIDKSLGSGALKGVVSHSRHRAH